MEWIKNLPHAIESGGYKIAYDFVVAILAGVSVGFFVDRRLRHREEKRRTPVRLILTRNLITITDTFLRRTMPILGMRYNQKACYLDEGNWIWVGFSAYISDFETEIPDASTFMYSSERYVKLQHYARQGLDLFELNQWEETRRLTEGIFQRYGHYLENDEFKTLSDLDEYLSGVIREIPEIRAQHPQDEFELSKCIRKMTAAWAAAYTLRSIVTRNKKTVPFNELFEPGTRVGFGGMKVESGRILHRLTARVFGETDTGSG